MKKHLQKQAKINSKYLEDVHGSEMKRCWSEIERRNSSGFTSCIFSVQIDSVIPNWNYKHAVNYIVGELRENGFVVNVLPPAFLAINWKDVKITEDVTEYENKAYLNEINETDKIVKKIFNNK